MTEGRRRLLFALIAVLIVGVVLTQMWADPPYLKMVERNRIKTGGQQRELLVKLPGQFIVASLAGFKEVIAGALWVRADTFFHEGNYQAIIPVVRLVTWLDPHNIDVYTTGAWHLDYNFTDQRNQLSDKRYIPASVALLKEGIRNNPNIWDLYFELGWTHYNKKMMDYDGALRYIEMACKKPGFDPNTGAKVPRPEFVDRMLAHAYERAGRFDDAIAQWQRARKNVENLLKKDAKKRGTYVDRASLDVCDRNLSMLYLRLGWRYGDMESYRKGVEIVQRLARRAAPTDAIRWASKGAAEDYARRVATNNPPRDALKPLDTGFEVHWKRVRPKCIRIWGKLNLVRASEYKDLASEPFTHWYQDNEKASADAKKLWRDGSRVYWRLQDYDYKMPSLDTFDWKIDTTKTIQGGGPMEGIYVGGGQFSEEIDLGDPRDAEMYPFKSDKYRLTIWVTPQDPGCPDFVQDRIGWRGDAIRDARYLDTTTIPGFRMLRTEFVIDRKDIL